MPAHAPRISVEELESSALDSRTVELLPASIHVWEFPLTSPAGSIESCAALLSDDERARAARFRFEKDNRRFTVSRASVRSILGEYTKTPARNLRFVYSHHGKPAVANPATEIRFSVSHSGELGLLAVTTGREVGVDVEAIRRNVETDQLAGRYFSDHERSALRELADGKKVRAFFRCWTSKEAFLKAQGIGLSRSLGSFDVEVDPDLPARLLATRPDAAEASEWFINDIPVQPEYAAALAWVGAIDEIKISRCKR